MANNTGNPVEPNGSDDPRDLIDNAAIADKLVNSSDLTWSGRLGKVLKTWQGIMQQVTDYLIAQSYESVYLTYGAGVVVQRQTQLVQRDGELYRVMNASDIPLTLTGTWATDAPKLQAVGDAALRQGLATITGSTLVGDASYPTVAQGLATIKAALLPENLMPAIVTDSALDRTYALTDIGKFNVNTNSAAKVRTIPTTASVAWPLGIEGQDMNDSGSTLRISPAAGVTLVPPLGKVPKVKLRGQYRRKKIGTDRWAITGDLEDGNYYGVYNAFGDSITFGVGSTPVGGAYVNGYTPTLARGMGRTIANQSVSASMVYDQAREVYRFTTVADSTNMMMLGTNDKRVYLDSAYFKDCFTNGYRACAVWMGTLDTLKTFPNNAACSYIGTWGNASYGKVVSKFATVVNSEVSVPFYGKTVYFNYLRVDGQTGAGEIYIDGILNGTINFAGPGMGTLLTPSQPAGPALYRVTNLSDGPHTIRMKITAISGAFTFLGISVPPTGSAVPRVNLLNVIREVDSSTDARTTAYNAIIDTIAAELRLDGMDIVVSNANGAISPTTDMFDNLHPNDSGHAKIARQALIDF